MIARICVFCGSSTGSNPVYTSAARDLGQHLVSRGVGLVYGGGSVGLMGVLADSMLQSGGSVTGVIPHALWQREVGHRGLTEVHIVDTMHERKQMMAELADGFVALPGGLGTFEEIFEIWTWAQLGLHSKPLGFLNVSGFYTPLLEFLDGAVGEGFVRPQFRDLAIVESDPLRMLERFEAYVPPEVQKWITRAET